MTNNKYTNNKKDKLIASILNQTVHNELFDLRLFIEKLAIDTEAIKKENADGFAELRESQKKLNSLLGNFANNQGSVAEEFFYNTLKHNPVLGDIQFDHLMPNLTAGCKGKQREYDIVLVNSVSVGIVEVKYKAHINDLEQVHAQIARFKRDCPEFKHYVIYGGIAALSIPSSVIKAAIAQGLFVLQQKGEHLLVQTEGMKAF
jgi:hypothetical protein